MKADALACLLSQTSTPATQPSRIHIVPPSELSQGLLALRKRRDQNPRVILAPVRLPRRTPNC
ncbi:MAG: hypothetical protein GY711_01955 [bacterium]|nr:hypothetical protein [bacterium]